MSDIIVPALVTVIVALLGYFGVRYKTNGRSIRSEIKELREANNELQREVDNLKLRVQPNPTPCIWLNQKEEVTGYNGAAVTKIFARVGRVGSDVMGKHISQVLGIKDFVLVKNALNSPSQVAKSQSFIIKGVVSTDMAIAYVIYDSEKNDAVVELQFIL